jgi:ATPase subunit of ABC transporter with duplicated ATPase domains
MLNVSNISKSYSALNLFSGISFNVGMGDRIAVIGQNGSGKTRQRQRKLIEGNLRNDFYRKITPVKSRIVEIEAKVAADRPYR